MAPRDSIPAAKVGGRLHNRSLHKSLSLYYGAKFVILLFGFIFQILMVKSLNPLDFSKYALLLAFLLAGFGLLSFGVPRTILRFVPGLTRKGKCKSLLVLGRTLLLVRLLAIGLFAIAVVFMFTSPELFDLSVLPSWLPVVYVTWFITYSLFIDCEALAQSWAVHEIYAEAAVAEIIVRTTLVAWFGFVEGDLGYQSAILICAGTSIAAVLWLMWRLAQYARSHLTITTLHDRSQETLDPALSHAPSFALAAFASTLGWWISSAAVIRVVANQGLATLPFAAFSFIQGLGASIQRALPGLLVLPSLEPIIARAASDSGQQYKEPMFLSLSLVFKLELVGDLSLIIIVTLAGADIISALSRPIYSEYYYIFPFVIGVQIIQTAYRICEIVLSAAFKHRVFLGIWPLSLLSLLAIYWTVRYFGLWGLLIIPIAEGVLKVGFLLVAYRADRIWQALDLRGSLLIFASAAIASAVATLVKYAMHVRGLPLELCLVTASLAVFIGIMFVFKPLQTSECALLQPRLPRVLLPLGRLAFLLAAPSPLAGAGRPPV